MRCALLLLAGALGGCAGIASTEAELSSSTNAIAIDVVTRGVQRSGASLRVEVTVEADAEWASMGAPLEASVEARRLVDGHAVLVEELWLDPSTCPEACSRSLIVTLDGPPTLLPRVRPHAPWIARVSAVATGDLYDASVDITVAP